MANFTLAVIGMTGHMMLMMVLVPTAAFIVIMLFMLVMVLVPTATLIILMLSILVVMMLMLLVCSVVIATAAFIVIMLFMRVVMLLMRSVVITTAAVIVLFRSMLMRMTAAITMAVLRDMPHAGMIMVLATVTTGAAFGMLAIILSPLNVAVYMSKAAHLFGGVTHIF